MSIRGALYSDPAPRASEDDIAEAISVLENAAQAVEDAKSALLRAHKTVDAYLGWSVAKRIADTLPLDKAHADLLAAISNLQMGRVR